MGIDRPNRKTLARKALHALGSLILAIQALLGLTVAQLVILAMLVLYTASEILRLSGRSLPLFAPITRIGSTEKERRGIITSPIWFALGTLITLTLLPTRAATIGVLTLTLGDPTAALIGQTIKRRHPIPINRSKTIEGTLTGYATATLVCSLLTDPLASALGCAAGMIAEALPLPINDNLTIPLTASVTGLAAYTLLN
jgi:dolichol kinase